MLLARVITILVLLPMVLNHELYGYDCNEPGVTTQVISLIDVGECKQPNTKPTKETTYGQLIQLSSINRLFVTNCRVFKSAWIYRCGMHSHQMLVGGPFLNTPVHLNQETCNEMLVWGKYSVSKSHTIDGIKVNRSLSVTITEEGSLSSDGSCEGVAITFQGTTYHKSFMRVVYDIRVQQYFADVDTSINKIYLRDDVSCSHDTGYCIDDLIGYTTWKPYNAPCDYQFPLLLHEGIITILREEQEPSLVHIKEKNFMFISKLNGGSNMCGRQVYTTDYQNIVLLITTTMNPKLQTSSPTGKQLNPSLYMNAKLSYLNYKTVDDINEIYQDVLRQLCALERKVLFNLLDIIRLTPQPTKHIRGLEQKGTLLHVKGEVAYITTCPIQKIQLRPSDTCYDGLPVLANNKSMFLLPVSRLLVPNVTEFTCSVIAPPLYKLDSTWISVTPNYVRTHEPMVLHPRTQLSNGPNIIKGFAEGGIYSKHDLDQFYKSLTQGETRDAAINHITQGLMTDTPLKYNIMNVVNEEGWKVIVHRQLSTMWGGFIRFGEIVSGMIGIYVIYIVISRIVQLIIRTLSLHRLYGCSWKLGAGLWSATTLLVTTFFRSTQPDDNETMNNNPEAKQEEIEMISDGGNVREQQLYPVINNSHTRL